MFREFLKSEFSEENIEFWLACEDYKKTKSDHLHGKAERIYEEFVQSDAIKQVCSKSICAVGEGEGVASLRCSHTQLHKKEDTNTLSGPFLHHCCLQCDVIRSHKESQDAGQYWERHEQSSAKASAA